MILRVTLFLLRCSIGAIAGSRKSYTGPAKDVRGAVPTTICYSTTERLPLRMTLRLLA